MGLSPISKLGDHFLFMVMLLLRGTSAAAPAPFLLATQGGRGRPIDLALMVGDCRRPGKMTLDRTAAGS